MPLYDIDMPLLPRAADAADASAALIRVPRVRMRDEHTVAATMPAGAYDAYMRRAMTMRRGGNMFICAHAIYAAPRVRAARY